MKKYREIILVPVLVAFLLLLTSFAVFAQDKGKPQAAPQEAAAFTVVRLVVGTGIDQREPVGVAESFPASTEKVFCFLEATSIAKDTEISFVWIYNQKEMLKTTMTMKAGAKWRTNANKNLRGLKGEWIVEIRDSAGNVIKDTKFKVE